jgi:hypothetical protein
MVPFSKHLPKLHLTHISLSTSIACTVKKFNVTFLKS